MPNAFDITTAATTVQLDDATRKGQASYAVKNVCGRPVRGEAELLSDQPQILEAGKEWIKIDGSEFRDFATDETEGYTVNIEVPMQAPAGTYGFWLKVVGIENTDEMTDIGPTIDFTVKELPKPAPWWKKLPWWVWAIAGGVLLLIIGLILFFALVPRTPAVFTSQVNMDTIWVTPPIPSIDYGSYQFLILYVEPGASNVARTVTIQPDVNLPHNRVSIQTATLRLRIISQGTVPNPLRISVSRATSAWDETMNAPTPTCDTQKVVTVAIPHGTTVQEINITDIYKSLHKAGANNFGICLTSPDAQYSFLLPSSEFTGDPALRPTIIVDYRH